jgi:WD40 repeat protein
MAFSPDAKTLALPKTSGVVELCNLTTGNTKLLPNPHGDEGEAVSLAFSKGGQYLAVSYARGITIWGMPGMRESVRIAIERFGMPMVFTDGDTALLALLTIPTDDASVPKGWNHQVVRWDISSGKRRSTVEFGLRSLFQALSPDGRYAVLEVKDERGNDKWGVFDLNTRVKVFELNGFGDWVFSEDGSALISWKGNRVSLLDVPSGKDIKHFDLTPAYNAALHYRRLSLSSDRKLLAVGGFPDANQAGLVSLESVKVLATVECGPPLTVCKRIRLSPDGRTLATITDGVNSKDQPVPPLFKLWRLPASW